MKTIKLDPIAEFMAINPMMEIAITLGVAVLFGGILAHYIWPNRRL